MRRRQPVIAGAVLAALLATVGAISARQPLRHAEAAMVGRGAYCLPTDGVSVGHICVLLG
jgi:hypothetical protein